MLLDRKSRILALPTLLLLLLLCEGAVRYFQAAVPAPESSPYVPHPAAGYVLRPSAPGAFPQDHDNHINAEGFRDRDHARRKPPRTLRILGIGDSHVYGDVPIRDNFLRVAERELAELLPPEAGSPEMVLMGVPGWGIDNCSGALASEGLELDPDLAVLAVSVGSDVTGIPITAEIIQGNLQFTGSDEPIHDALRHSRLFVLAEQIYLHRIMSSLRSAVSSLAGTSAPDAAAGGSPAGVDVNVEQGGAVGGGEPGRGYLRFVSKQLPLFDPGAGPGMERLWREAAAQIAEFDRICREAGIPWLLLPVPEEVQVDPQLRSSALAALDRDPADFDFDLPQRRLAAVADSLGAPILDPLPALRKAHRPGSPLYIPGNFHWNDRGSLEAGCSLASFIAEMVAATPEGADAFGLGKSEG